MQVTTEKFKGNVKSALGDDALRSALKRATTQFVNKRKTAVAALANFEALREYCGAVKAHTLDYLDYYTEQLADSIESAGGHIHFAADAAEANQIITDIAKKHNVKTAVKSKSMLSEEVNLNAALEKVGVIPIETDLGEYVLQIDQDVPSHIIAPIVHRSKEYVMKLFHEKLGTPADADVPQLTAAARQVLRQGFLEADMGITGANFAVAETGTVALVENEGNIRFSSSLPRVHVAMMGMEKIIPRLRDLPAFLAVLPRSATGQKSTSYVSMINGPRRDDEVDGPDEFHLVLVDNGRTGVLADPKLRDALRCIRCGACLNACPVYQQVGGHAYGWVYPGPIGAVLNPGLLGLEGTTNLPQASSLCGACGEVCPVKIPLPELLIEHRRRGVERGLTPKSEQAGIGAFAFIAQQPGLWDAGTKVARLGSQFLGRKGYLHGGWIPIMKEWLRERDFPQPPQTSFREIWRQELKHDGQANDRANESGQA
ncbi:MAG: LutB/LldF family L-lactate oxidation iron-sulfur protein [Trueperaceae bacterium]|nr:LutB/LldF family L-lactate oxidation iron-sulfur protein [Trueperaceae bacterium]